MLGTFVEIAASGGGIDVSAAVNAAFGVVERVQHSVALGLIGRGCGGAPSEWV